MADRRTSECLIVPAESLERIDLPPMMPSQGDVTEETQPMRLSFLALLADSNPVVQARLERRRTLALEDDLDELQDEEDGRPTDPMFVVHR